MKSLTKDARRFIDSVTKYIGAQRGGAAVLPKVESMFAKVTVAAKKERDAKVTTAVSLTVEEKNAVARMVSEVIGHDVECHFFVDGEVLGGLKVQVADWVIDTSLNRQLASIAQSLHNL